MSLTESLLRTFMENNPQAHYAALHDVEEAATVHRTRIVLEALSTALEAEGLDMEARRRVGTRLVDTCLLSDRARKWRSEVERLAATTPAASIRDALR
ncbi:hypothetical protein [Streptomyces fuscigenes]|uniref:hypothetical protein n=1 Tax=Streptomyces fuscigenes TaxID=1528880 RepID=UPI001F465823|nr:hypothetical protein [Streptomyces fuscigenes]MCF3960276.1 hypothetical protein [Streptomyces fuscigenes]